MSDDLEVTVDPGDIDEFASNMLEAADYWADSKSGAYKLVHANEDDDHYPSMGKFTEADDCIEAHYAKWDAMAKAFQQVHALLEGLAEGSKKVAEQYRDLEDLNSADAESLDALLEPSLQEAMADAPEPSQPDTNQEGR